MHTQLKAPPKTTEQQHPAKPISPGFGLIGFLSLAALSGLCPHAWSQGKETASAGPSKSSDSSKLPNIAGARPNPFNKPYGSYLNPILEYIQADADQRTKITGIVQSFRGRIEPLTIEYKQKNQALLDNLVHGQAPELIMDEQTELGRLYSEITLYYCQMSLEVRKCLNAEQIVRYEDFKRKQGWSNNASNATASSGATVTNVSDKH
jgi:hypothetical protein